MNPDPLDANESHAATVPRTTSREVHRYKAYATQKPGGRRTTGPGRPACRCEKPAQGAAAPKTRTPGSAAVVEGHLVAVGVRERESAAERPVDGR